MKRSSIRAFALLGAIGISLSTGVANASVAAYPSDHFAEECNDISGCVSGVVNWSNRSANLAVSLFDDRNAGSTTVVVDFYSANGFFSDDTRTANNERIPGYPSSGEGPVGGINVVDVWLVANAYPDAPRHYVGTYYRDF
jgi:hypothetical protein